MNILQIYVYNFFREIGENGEKKDPRM